MDKQAIVCPHKELMGFSGLSYLRRPWKNFAKQKKPVKITYWMIQFI
jgi:hypothetical protein